MHKYKKFWNTQQLFPFFLNKYQKSEPKIRNNCPLSIDGLVKTSHSKTNNYSLPNLFNLQHPTSHNLLVSDVETPKPLTIKANGSDTTVRSKRAIAHDSETLVATHLDVSTPEDRTRQVIARSGRADRIEAQGREYVPSRHLTSIVISTQTSRSIQVLSIEDMTDGTATLIMPANEIVHISHMMARLVSVPIV